MSKKLNVKGADPRLESLFDYFVSDWPDNEKDLNTKSRDIWADRIRKAASQPGFDFEPALRRFLAYVLVGSKRYSALASAKNSSYSKKREIAKIVIRVARLINRGASSKELLQLRRAADVAARESDEAAYAANAVGDKDTAVNADDANGAVMAARNAINYKDANSAHYAGSGVGATYYAVLAADPAYDAANREFAAALLYFVEQEAYGRGKRRGNPASEKVPSLERLLGTRKTSRNAAPRSANPKTAKKTAKRKTPAAKTLISKCQKAWDHYCERPSKKRLKEVFDHLEVMKESSAKTVKDERARCLRAANKEAKRLGMKK